MTYIPAVGATCCGIVIGWLVRYFIRRFNTFGPMVLGSLISIVLGGTVIKFLDADKRVWWFYPIGLLGGFVIYHLVAVIHDMASTPGTGSGGTVKIPGKGDPYRMR
jgi:hypothetical protein